MQDHIFRMYDIRGIIGEDFSIDALPTFARALAYYYQHHGMHVRTVSIAMDERDHSPLIKEKIIPELLKAGISVIDIGLAPTPVSYFSDYWLPIQGSIMITASHNPHEYNGIKLSLHKKAICGSDLQQLKNYFLEQRSVTDQVNSGTYRTYALTDEYITYLATLFPHLKGNKKKIVFDCGSGATAAVLPQLCRAMGWHNAQLLSGIPGNQYRTHEADPTVKQNMEELVEHMHRHGSDVGIGFDGDGDRMDAVTEDGFLVPGDQLLAVMAQPLFEHYHDATMVAEIKCSNGLTELVEQWGGRLVHCPAGRTFIKKAMEQEQALVAGELSCHFFFHDRYFGYDDGIYAALRLLECIELSQKSLSMLVSIFPCKKNSPELRVACSLEKAPAVIHGVEEFFAAQHDVRLTTIDGVRVDRQGRWGIVRASNTQPVICLRFEANTEQDLEQIRKEFVDSLRPYFAKDFLEQQITW